MGSPYFQFQQFRIWHDRCAMKVGTDGVLLGAWASLPERGRVLDIGCGSGLISLMVAQRAPQCHITGIDIDEEAVAQAQTNATASPWAERIDFHCVRLQDYKLSGEMFDAIVCNPPFHEEELLPPSNRRSAARHTTSLPFAELVHCLPRLLCSKGIFNVVLPIRAVSDFSFLCWEQGVHLTCRTDVVTRTGKPPRRSLLSFVRTSTPLPVPPVRTLILCDEQGQRSTDYEALTRDFYLST